MWSLIITGHPEHYLAGSNCAATPHEILNLINEKGIPSKIIFDCQDTKVEDIQKVLTIMWNYMSNYGLKFPHEFTYDIMPATKEAEIDWINFMMANFTRVMGREPVALDKSYQHKQSMLSNRPSALVRSAMERNLHAVNNMLNTYIQVLNDNLPSKE